MRSLSNVVVLCFALVASLPVVASDKGGSEKEKDRIRDSATVMREIMSAPDKGIPGEVLEKSKCVIVLPSVKKAALGIGGTYGRGVMTCRSGAEFKGRWSAPIMMATEGGNFGFQIGAEGTDFVIVVMNESGARAMMHNKLKLGGDVSIAAGLVGRTGEASTNQNFKAEMLSYSRSRGVFAGVSLSGATLRPDNEGNEHLYGEKMTAEQIMNGQVTMPEEAKPLVEAISQAGRETRGSR